VAVGFVMMKDVEDIRLSVLSSSTLLIHRTGKVRH
jgi:hypothetical protein